MRGARGLFWAMVAACFTAVLACLAARAVDRFTTDSLRGRDAYLIVRITAPEGPEGLNRAAEALRADRAVETADPMSTARAARLLELWSGGSVQGDDLPPLRLIEVMLTPEAPRGDAAERNLVAVLSRAGVSAEAIGPPDDGAATRARLVRRAAFLAALTTTAAMALIIALAARAMAARRGDLVTVLADLGARRGRVALQLADDAGAAGFFAGIAGALVAGLAAALAAAIAFPEIGATLGRFHLTALDLAPLIAAPFAAALIAGAGARWAAGALYARAARLG